MGMDMLDQHTAEGKARRAAAEKRMAAGNGPKTTSVHVSGGGGRAQIAGFGGEITGPRTGSGSGGGGGGKPKPIDIYREKMAKMESAPVRNRTQGSTNVLDENRASIGGSSKAAGSGSGGGGGGGADAADARAARAAHFEKVFAEQQAKKKAAAEAAGFA